MKAKINIIVEVLNKHMNGYMPSSDIKSEITTVFSNESFSSMLSNLSRNGKSKSIELVILVLGYLLCNLDSKEEIVTSIKENHLENVYFGGLRNLFVGKSKTFSIKVDFDDSRFENKLKYVNMFEPNLSKLYFIFLACEILYDINPENFEKILIDEKALYFLLVANTHFINYQPSEEFLKKLINSENELQRNVALSFIVEPIEHYINGKTDDEISAEEFNTMLEDFYSVLDTARPSYIVSLLFNYVLINMRFPVDFIARLSREKYLDELCFQISKSNKIKFVRELHHIATSIFKYAELNFEVISNTICECFMNLFENSYFSLDYEEKEKFFVEEILKLLPVTDLLHMREYFSNYDNELMISELDKMIRYKFYLTDIKKHNCIIHIVKYIDDLLVADY